MHIIYSIIGLFLVITSSMTIIFLLTPTAKKIPPDLHKFLSDYEDFTLIFFAVEYILRFWVSSDFYRDFKENFHQSNSYLKALIEASKVKIRWMLKPTSLIDLISILPILRPLRVFRLLFLLRLLKLFRYSSPLKFIFYAFKESIYVYLVIILLISLMIFMSSSIVYVYEHNNGNKDFNSLGTAIYWGIITSMTVGYGDIIPTTDVGRFFASFLSIFTVILISALTATFSASFVSRLFELKEGNVMVRDLENHIVICGYNETSEEILEGIMNLGIDKERAVVLITNFDKNQLGIELSDFIIYKKGDFIMEKTLLEAGVDKASDVIVVGEKFENLNDRNIDARTALTGMLVKSLNPNVRLYIEVLLDEDAEVFKNRVKAKDVLIHGQIIGKIMFSSLLNPGATQLVETIIDNESGIKKLKVREFGHVKTFGELLKAARLKNILPVGIERNKEIILNPPDNFEVEEKDYVFIIQRVG
ncbi:MAG: ion transporter [Hydrogenothermaceae bacterium]|nr:ion transporter [Hydrogenothermaceae bacterium]